MATLIPDLSESQLDALESTTEAKVYRALRDQLPADYTVFFRGGWILRREDEHAKGIAVVDADDLSGQIGGE